jgi:DNA-binding MarR family transcriptional regulator
MINIEDATNVCQAQALTYREPMGQIAANTRGVAAAGQRRRRPRLAGAAAARREPPARTEAFIIYKVGLLAKLLDRQSTPWFAERFGLTLAAWRTLTHLYVCSPATARALAARMHVDKGEVSRALRALIARAVVARRDDPADKRSALFCITARGRRLHDAILPLRQATQDELAACLDRGELAVLHRALDKLLVRAIDRSRRNGAGKEKP